MVGGSIRILAGLFAAAATTAAFAPARAAPPATDSMAQSCFDIGQHQGVLALDDRTVLVRVGPSIYRIDLADRCPGLSRPNPRITFVAHGASTVCGRLDYSLQVGENNLPGIPCTVASQRRLSPDEVAALPPRRRP